jgi:1,4-dihydroxy-2-naphthoate octaprenyltransferase
LGVPAKALYVYAPVLALSAALTLLVLLRRYEDQNMLERLCGLNLILNVGTTISYVYAFA